MFFLCLLTLLLARPALAAPIEPGNRQMVLVISEDWNSSEARLQLFGRSAEGAWKKSPLTPSPWRARIGRNGLGWGGVAECPEADAPTKKEGDGKAPAGVFPLLSSFGFPEEQSTRARMPFTKLTSDWEGVDDPKSTYYNQILDTRKVEKKDWDSFEKMLIPEYQVGLRVGYNTDPPVPGLGSCIFMHIFSVPEKATSGCTAVSLTQMRSLRDWLDPQLHPILIQLPRCVYEKVQGSWGLP